VALTTESICALASSRNDWNAFVSELAFFSVLAAVSKRFPKYWFGAFLRYDWLGGAEFANSPLMRRENSLAGGFGFAWMISESKRRVTTDD